MDKTGKLPTVSLRPQFYGDRGMLCEVERDGEQCVVRFSDGSDWRGTPGQKTERNNREYILKRRRRWLLFGPPYCRLVIKPFSVVYDVSYPHKHYRQHVSIRIPESGCCRLQFREVPAGTMMELPGGYVS